MHRSAPPYLRWLRRTIFALSVILVVAACSNPASTPVEAPTTTADSYAVPPGDDLNVPAPGVAINDELRDGTVDAATVTTTAGGTATLFEDGRLLYEPLLGFDGFDSFEYTASSAGGTSSPAAVTIEVPSAPWVPLPPLPEARSRTVGAVVNGTFYVMGGEVSGGGYPGTIFAYRRTTGTWDASREPIPTSSANACATAIGTDIYVVGGYTGSGLDTLQRYDTVADAWTVVATDPLPTPLYAATCQAVDGKIFVFGGAADGTPGTTSWSYDPTALATTRWSTGLAPLPLALHYPASAVVDGDIFVVGGLTSDSAAVFAYDPDSDAWTPYPDMLEGRGGPAAWSVGPILYVGAGGWSSYLTTVEAYDTRAGTSGTWVSDEPLSNGRRTLAYASDPDQGWLYAAAGWDGAFDAASEEGLLRARVP